MQQKQILDLNEKGFVLATSFMMVSVVFALAFAMFARGNNFLIAAERNQNRIVALNMAEAGVNSAIIALENDDTYSGSAYSSLSTSTTTGGYSITVTTPNDNANVRLIQATGYAPSNDNTSRAYEARTVNAYVEFEPQSLFNHAIFSNTSIQLSGNAIIDSYNSDDGAYNAGTAGNNGDIGTNSTSNSIVSLTGNARVEGDASIGPDGDTSTAISLSGHADITGTEAAAEETTELTPQTTSASSSGALSLSGNTTLTLSAGTYHYSSISITGNARITATGAVSIYVDGNISIAGNGFSTSSNKPTNMLIYSSGSSVSFSGNANFYGAMHAPNASVSNSGNGIIYGAVVADSYRQTGNGAIHYDEALQNVTSSEGSEISMLAWKENNTLLWS